MRRRDFISKVAVGGSILFVSSLYLSSCSKSGESPMDPPTNTTGPISIDLSDNKYASLNTVGGYTYYDKYMIIRTSDSQYVVLSKYCTHQNYLLEYLPSSNQIKCNNHGSVFTIAGVVVNGPASRSLPSYNASLSGTILTIS